jgi:hypothetical protein
MTRYDVLKKQKVILRRLQPGYEINIAAVSVEKMFLRTVEIGGSETVRDSSDGRGLESNRRQMIKAGFFFFSLEWLRRVQQKEIHSTAKRVFPPSPPVALCVVPFGAKIAIGASPKSVLLRDFLGLAKKNLLQFLAAAEFIPEAPPRALWKQQQTSVAGWKMNGILVHTRR